MWQSVSWATSQNLRGNHHPCCTSSLTRGEPSVQDEQDGDMDDVNYVEEDDDDDDDDKTSD